MSRALTVVLLLLCLPVTSAWATEQVRERIIVGGRVLRMPATPLEPLLRRTGQRPFDSELHSTNLHRGYVGTWLLEGDGLHLVSLMRYAYEGQPPRRVEKDIPLSVVFGDRPPPIPATWWSGRLVLPQGNVLRAAVRSRDNLYERTVYLELKDGRIASTRVVDNREEGRGLSTDDLLWVTQAASSPADDGAWHDGRSIGSAAFRQAVPSGTTFRTRGVLSTYDPDDASLWIPTTPATHIVRIKLSDVPEEPKIGGMPHVELEATWERIGSETVLRVVSVRRLEPGETIHHPDFVVPELPAETLLDASAELDVDAGYDVRDGDDLGHYFGHLISLHGVLLPGEVSTLHGVEVAGDEALDGEAVVAVGLLERWVVSQTLIETDPAAGQLFRTRGPGTYHRLVHPATGKLVRPRRTTGAR